MPPSKAGKPVTSAPETDASIETPSPEKTEGASEEVRTGGEVAKQAEARGRTSDSVSGSAAASTASGSGVGRARSNPTMKVAGTAKSHATPKAGGGGRRRRRCQLDDEDRAKRQGLRRGG